MRQRRIVNSWIVQVELMMMGDDQSLTAIAIDASNPLEWTFFEHINSFGAIVGEFG